jgi:ubiquinone/menaquinone biosynthesis C-methylase UbiE
MAENSQDRTAAPDPRRIMQLSTAFYGSALLFTAADAGVFAHLAQAGGADAAAIAAACGMAPRAARLILDGCAAIGLLEKKGEQYRNAPDAAAFLVPGGPGDLSGAIRYARDVYPAWGKLPEFAAGGRPVERPELHLGEDADRTRAFVLAMHARATAIGRAVVPRLDLAGRRTVLDVGGGPGTYSVLIARQYPSVERCTVLDLEEVVRIADALIADSGVADRVQTQAGDYHTAPFPAGQDAVLFFGMLHQEPPESIEALLGRAFDALNPGGAVYVMDMMTDATRTAPPFSALFALNMALTAEHGWVFSDSEIVAWLEHAGFTAPAVAPLPPPMPHWLASASKPVTSDQ